MTVKKYLCLDCGIKDICTAPEKRKKCPGINFKWYEIKECKEPGIMSFSEAAEFYKEPEEPELMTFFEAWEKAEDGDKIQDFPDFVTKGKTDIDSMTWNIGHLNRKTWQIIPAEPKVLTPEEYFNKKYFKKGGGVGSVNIKDVFRDGEENQWLNHKDMREAVEKFMNDYPEMINEDSDYNPIVKALKNLKPLKAE